MMSPTKNEVNF